MNKILIVEDDNNTAELLKDFLEEEGYLVVAADRGRTAIEWIKEMHVDLAIVDLGLPDISGFEVCRHIKENPKTRSIPIIILTGNPTNAAKIEGNLEANADLFLNKPFNVDDLGKAVTMLFEKVAKRKLLLRNSLKTRFDI